MRFPFIGLVLCLFVPTLLQAEPLSVGQTAPQVTALNQEGRPVRFSDVYAQGITLIYFYPKAGTSGCTSEACSLRDAYTKLHARGLRIVGVSRDDVSSQKKFQDENHLPFTLIADRDGQVAKAFGVPTILGFLPVDSRESFIVQHGKIAWNSLHAQTTGSAEEVQRALDRLEKN